jgi:DNA-binding NarL/FixJ family response regulator
LNCKIGFYSGFAEAEKMRTLLVDDQNVARESLARALELEVGISLVMQAESAKEAIELQQRHRFDLAVIEFATEHQSGFELIREIKTFHSTRVLVLSCANDEFSVGEAMRAGADGYLSKRAHLPEVVAAIRTISSGRVAVSQDVSAAMVRALHRRESPGSGDVVANLSERERQVLRLLALGSSAKEIAGTLKISVKTVETHRARLCAKVATHSVADLTRLAVRSGLITA